MLLLLLSATYALAAGAAPQAEAIQVSGIVTDSVGTPLPGVSIVVKGTTTGTSTDNSGKFVLACNEGSVLVFSFIGYRPQEVTAVPGYMTVRMREDAAQLGEVVVVSIGYGNTTQRNVTGAINSVSQEKFNKGVIASPEQLIQGKVAGLTIIRPGGDPTTGSAIRLRGGTSLTAGNYPLVVIDGVPGVDLNTVSPNDIASIDVLKDASATAIYGARAANGVIIINTKRAQEGKAQIDYNGYVAVGEAANTVDMLSGNQWRQYVRDNNLTGAQDYGANTDWQDAIMQTAISHAHSLSLSAGSDKTLYRASVNYLNNEGIVITSNLSRLNGKLFVQQKALNDKLKIDMNLSQTYEDIHPADYTAFKFAYNINPTVPVYGPDGEYFEVKGLLDYNNPVAMLEQRKDFKNRSRFMGVIKADMEVVSGLHAVVNTSMVRTDYKGRFFLPSNSVYGEPDRGYAQQDNSQVTDKLLELYLSYDKKLEDHHLGLVGGYSYFVSNNEWFGAQRRGFDTDDFMYDNLGAGQDFRAGDVWSGRNNWKLISFFGRANYDYKGKYLASFSLRRDGSSKFGKNNKWGLFPSGSIAWNLMDERFMQPASGWLNDAKLRVGYGVTGNQEGIAPYKSLALSGPSGDYYYDATSKEWKTGYGPIQNPNPDLKWESTAQLDIGLDFALFGKITGTIDYYEKKTSDLLFTYAVPQPPYLYGSILANVGDLSNKGLELTLSTQVLRTDKFSWTVDFNMAYNKQKIASLSNQVYTTDAILSGYIENRGFSSTYTQVIREGYVPGTYWGLKSKGVDENGKYIFQDITGEGNITDDDKQILGDAQPDYTGGLGMSFKYSQWDLSFFMNGVFGQKLLNATMMSIMDDSRLPSNNVPDAAIGDGLKDSPKFSDYWIENGSFARLQNISLGYTLPAKVAWLRNARVYVTGENLFVLTGYSGADPEINLDGLATPGIDNFNYYPKPRTYSVGVSVSF